MFFRLVKNCLSSGQAGPTAAVQCHGGQLPSFLVIPIASVRSSVFFCT